MAQGGWTDTGGRCREAERFPTGGFALGERTIEAFHGKAARAWRTLRCVHRPAFEHRKRRSACCGDRFRSAGSGVREAVILEKRCTRAWLKYMVAALCGALLMLAILLMLKLPEDTHNEPTSEVKYAAG